MSNYKIHLIVGTIIVALTLFIINFFTLINTATIIYSLLAGIIFSLLPDIDARKSLASHILHTLTITSIITLIIIFDLRTIIFFFTTLILESYHIFFSRSDRKHRQIPHTIIFGIGCATLFALITNNVVAGSVGLVAFGTHLVLDTI